MATSYNDIYCLNKLIKNDPRLKHLTPVDYSMLCFGYLKFAISYFMYDCRKDLSTRVDPSIQTYTFDGDGTETQFVLSPAPTEGSDFYVVVKTGDEDSEITSFSYNNVTNVLELPEAVASGSVLTVTAYIVGEFAEDLDDREKVILAEAMNIPYLEEAKNDQNAMKYIVTGKSLRFFSQANHIGASVENYNSQAYNIVDGLISEYSYKGSVDSYRGLAKRGSGG